MPAPEELQGVGVERLNPERKEADTESAPVPDALRVDVLRIGLEGNPGAVLDRKVSASCFKNPADVLRRERRGGAAAEVDRVDGIKRGAIRGPERDLGNQVIGEPPSPFRPAGQDREVAVGTDGGAERDVEVEAGKERLERTQIRFFQEPGLRRRCITANTATISSFKMYNTSNRKSSSLALRAFL
jgi:hypothetical protein